MKHAIKDLFHIDASKQKVFEAISSIEGLSNWWTTQTSGNAAPGGIIQFRFGEMGPDMKVTEVQPSEKVAWECVASPFGWVGNTFIFLLDENEGKTRVRFSHEGWEEQDDFYAICAFTWGRYLESLRQYCQTGRGEAFGSPGYRK
jgi:uncharacterized protein YndB with AHSA1/START domain